MKVVVFSDVHLDCSTGGLPRFDDIVSAIHEVITASKREGADLVMFLGDLTNPDSVRAHQAVATAMWVATHLWFVAGIATRWVVGNHDIVEDGSGTSSMQALKAFGDTLPGVKRGCIVYDTPILDVVNDINILALPFTARSHPYDPVEFVRKIAPGEEVGLVVAHLNIEGIEPGSETADMPRGREVFLPVDAIRARWPMAVILNGHYHRRQTSNGVHVPGSLARLTFGEECNSPGYLVVEV